MFNKIKEDNFPNLKKGLSIEVQVAYRIINRREQKRKQSSP